MKRRGFLGSCGVVAAGVITGCAGGDAGRSATPAELDDVAGSYSGYQGGPRHTGYGQASGPSGGFAEAWSAVPDESDRDVEFEQPAVVDGTVYATHVRPNDDAIETAHVQAFDATTGEKQWEQTVEDSDAVSGPAVGGSSVVASTTDSLYAYDVNDGTERWAVPVSSPVSPVVADGTVYALEAGLVDATLSARSLDDGFADWQWTYTSATGAVDPVAVVDGTVYVPADDGLHALSAADGTEQWHVETDRAPVTAPTVADGTVYAGTVQSGLVAVSVAEQSQQWLASPTAGREPTEHVVPRSPAVADDAVVTVTAGTVSALDPSDGSERWHRDAGVESAPVVSGSIAYVAGTGSLSALSVVDGSTVGSVDTGGSGYQRPPPVALASGVVFAPLDGLYALQ